MTISLCGEREREKLSGISPYKGTNLILMDEGLIFLTFIISYSKETAILGLGFQHELGGGTHTFGP